MSSLRNALLAATVFVLPAVAPAQKIVLWGRNDFGQSVDEYNRTVVQADGGSQFTAVRYESGQVGAWGNNDYGQTNFPTNLIVKQIACGPAFTVALLSNGTVTGWGFNQNGQYTPPAGLIATQVAAGLNFSLALGTDGTIAAFGANTDGQCNVPVGLTAVQVAAGSLHGLALRADGSVVGWGANTNGQASPPGGLVAKDVAAGAEHSLAVRTDGTVAAWGRNFEGQCNVPAGLTAVQVSGGSYHSLAVRPDGTVAAWGNNGYGQCNVPADLTGVLEVAGGGYHSIALVAAVHATLDQREVFAGDSATGTVRLAHLEASNFTVGLTSSDPRVHVPATVVMPYGSTTKTFPVSTDAFIGPDIEVKITTVNNNVIPGAFARKTVSALLKLKGTRATASFASASVVGGSTTRPKLNLTLDTALTSPTTLDIVNPAPGVLSLPATLTVPAGQKTVSISVLGTSRVANSQTVPIQLKSGETPVATAPLTVNPIRTSVTFVSPTVQSGESDKGAIYLNASVANALTIPLTSGDPSVGVPPSVTVAAGARLATFPITTSAVGTSRTVPITATIGGSSFAGNLKLLATPAVKSLTLPSSVFGNGRVVGTVRLNISGRPGGTVVQLSSSDSAVSVPASVTVPEGQYAATFEATASDVASARSVVVTAENALGAASSGVTINPLAVDAVALSASTAAAGSAVTITVTLNTTVAVATPISLASADPILVPVPATLTVPAGSRTATITVTVGHATTAKNVRITASKHASSQYRTLKVTP